MLEILRGNYSLKSKNVLPTKTEGETSTFSLAIFAREEDFPPKEGKETGELFEIQSDLVAIVAELIKSNR